ncbi:GlsB/YeaQ/YmgE family stress response membrane protein [Salsipaludibacter albus]|uniref:GlsB/YeaQ/YmgE family stress response membrane protein n=1 Tax=Salsipaludibacter albus TaxID=2849650 RepID=UPI001EE3CDA9|nr:GlsB/YeaQ/YmgE family stress response membrane protein [Salsipaludibacter albus]MBY5161457.1 GlsB/YeaQ/YmgE family stress response membrane protein [Salsipaludibacter albus]
MEIVWTIIFALLAGIIIGPLARLVIPGKQDVSIGMTILLGAVGALVGGLIYGFLGGTETDGIDWIELLVQVAVAAIVIVIYLNTQGRSTSSTR